MNTEVSIARCNSYEPHEVRQGLINALAPIGGLDWVTPGMRIAVKVNMMTRIKPERAATTHPQIVFALCELLRERGASVVVGDSPGGPFSLAYLSTVYSGTGMRQVLDAGATLNDDFSIVEVDYPGAVTAKAFPITNYLVAADAITTIMAAKDEDRLHIVRETADLWFHSLVLLTHFGLGPDDVLAELHRREGISGIDEKKSRGS